MPRASRASVLAQRLLDAQVRFHLEELSEARLAATTVEVLDGILDALGQFQVEDLLDREQVIDVIARGLATAPGSAAARSIVGLLTEGAHAGPDADVTLGALVDRDQVEVLVDAVFALHPLVERSLDDLTESPLVGTVAGRFMTRIVGEAMQANQEIAGRVPGLGSLVSFGTNATTRMVGAADRQLSGALTDSMGKGGTFAVRRLNKVILETLRDPVTQQAVMQVWDLNSDRPLGGGFPDEVSHDHIRAVTDAAHEVTLTALAQQPTRELVAALVHGFLDHFGGYTPTELLVELDIDREELVADLAALAARSIEVLRDSGDLEALVRQRLEPFYTSAEVLALLT